MQQLQFFSVLMLAAGDVADCWSIWS